MDATQRICLFDIDGTLITTGGAGRFAMGRAFGAVHGVPDAMADITLAGKTDPQIYGELVARFRVDPQPVSFRRLYLRCLREELPRFNGRGQVLPGVSALLQELARQPGVRLGLLTGNWRRGAYLKLQYYGLADYFPFGAFGDDSADRLDLPAVALRRAARRWPAVGSGPARGYVIGDTARDIACARAGGCVAVAVATGEYPAAELARHDPDHLFADLADTGAVIRALGLPAAPTPAYPNCTAFLSLTQS
jgi:phosphoglycolate phosphatase